MTFSIIIPLYNKGNVVGATIQSVLDQQEDGFELIIINDGSTDDGADIVRSFGDNRIRLFTIKNSGPGAARNYGIQQAHGKWILFLDADDILLPEALHSFQNAIKKWPSADLIAANFYISGHSSRQIFCKNGDERQLNNPFREWFYKRLMPCAGTFVCKKDVILQFPYDESLRRNEDVDMLFRLFRDNTVVRIESIVMEYQRENSSLSVVFPPIEKDYKGHLSFDHSKSIWEKICLYEFYIEAKNTYHADAARLYPFLRHRYGLILAYHLAFWHRALIRK